MAGYFISGEPTVGAFEAAVLPLESSTRACAPTSKPT